MGEFEFLFEPLLEVVGEASGFNSLAESWTAFGEENSLMNTYRLGKSVAKVAGTARSIAGLLPSTTEDAPEGWYSPNPSSSSISSPYAPQGNGATAASMIRSGYDSGFENASIYGNNDEPTISLNNPKLGRYSHATFHADATSTGPASTSTSSMTGSGAVPGNSLGTGVYGGVGGSAIPGVTPLKNAVPYTSGDKATTGGKTTIGGTWLGELATDVINVLKFSQNPRDDKIPGRTGGKNRR